MTSINFVYQPNSGDRVFCQKTCQYINVLKYANGCKHVVGGVLLKFFHMVETPGGRQKNIRGNLREAAKTAVRSFGGIGWDNQGEINLVIPVKYGKTVLEFFKMIYTGQDILSDPAWDKNALRLSEVGYPVMIKPLQVGSGRFYIEVGDLDFLSATTEPLWGGPGSVLVEPQEERYKITVRWEAGQREIEFRCKWSPVFEEGNIEAPRPPAVVD